MLSLPIAVHHHSSKLCHNCREDLALRTTSHKGLHNHYVSRWYQLTCGELVGIPRRAAFSEDDGYDRYQSKSSMLHQTSSPKPTKRKYQKEYNGFTPNQGGTMEEKTNVYKQKNARMSTHFRMNVLYIIFVAVERLIDHISCSFVANHFL